ncbi:hypothetical protein F3Y22_tig00117032pilonHSYRG00002 [Hibiscus syriacus]|uniref:Uncharacterized protein n=1 Tax=Hibiscus syriacus TaxID=106335 RepID=A0A6A2XFM5_HIBSY|nr:hypothetical protein F3Y22_tig00117032pilonHSYRG00002 [Hibiscus syriacus]
MASTNPSDPQLRQSTNRSVSLKLPRQSRSIAVTVPKQQFFPLCFLLGGIHWIFEEKEIIISNSESNNFHEIKEAYVKFLANDVHGLKKIYHKNLEAFFSRVTVCRDTIFHVAAYRGSEEMLEILVKLLPPARKRELLRMKNVYGNTVLCACSRWALRGGWGIVGTLYAGHRCRIRRFWGPCFAAETPNQSFLYNVVHRLPIMRYYEELKIEAVKEENMEKRY